MFWIFDFEWIFEWFKNIFYFSGIIQYWICPKFRHEYWIILHSLIVKPECLMINNSSFKKIFTRIQQCRHDSCIPFKSTVYLDWKKALSYVLSYMFCMLTRLNYSIVSILKKYTCVLGVTLLLFSRYYALQPTWTWYRILEFCLALLHVGRLFHSFSGNLRFCHHCAPGWIIFCSVANHLWLSISGSHFLYGGRSFLCRSSVSCSSSHMLVVFLI